MASSSAEDPLAPASTQTGGPAEDRLCGPRSMVNTERDQPLGCFCTLSATGPVPSGVYSMSPGVIQPGCHWRDSSLRIAKAAGLRGPLASHGGRACRRPSVWGEASWFSISAGRVAMQVCASVSPGLGCLRVGVPASTHCWGCFCCFLGACAVTHRPLGTDALLSVSAGDIVPDCSLRATMQPLQPLPTVPGAPPV